MEKKKKLELKIVQYMFKDTGKKNVFYMGDWVSQVVLVIKNLPAYPRDLWDAGSMPGPRRSPGGGLDN